MINWYNEVSRNLDKIPDCIAYFDKELREAKKQCKIYGNLEKASAALPGIVAGFIMAISRAIGETMIVVMAAGLAANMTVNPLEAVTTVTVQIVTLLIGDQEFDSAKTLSAFALAFALFTITFILNWIAYRNYKNAVNRLKIN